MRELSPDATVDDNERASSVAKRRTMTELKRRNRRRQILTLKERLLESAEQARTMARQMAPCRERESLIRKARLAETTAALDEWIRSPGLRSPD
jgi:hypothetical protein